LGPSLAECTEYGGELQACGYLGQEEFSFLQNMQQVDYLFLQYCESVRTLSGLERLQEVGTVWIEMPVLETIAPLRLHQVTGDLYLWDSPLLVSLRGFDDLEWVSGSLQIGHLDSLETLEGLKGLRQVGRLLIVYNDSLRGFEGLESLERVDGNVFIYNNPQISQTQVEAFLSRLDIGGSIRTEQP